MPDEEFINLEKLPATRDFYKKPGFEKERGATWVAKGLVCIFGGVVFVSLVGGFAIIGLCPPAPTGADVRANIVRDAVLPLLQGVGTFASTVFGPLLAFVLGYYFGEKKQEGTTP